MINKGIVAKEPIFSYDTKNNKFPTLAKRIPREPYTFDIILHGNAEFIEFFMQDYSNNDLRTRIDAYTLSIILKKRKDYKNFIKECSKDGKSPCIRLLSCSTGNIEDSANCFAQQLANEMNVRVKAPDSILYVLPDGRYSIGETEKQYFEIFYSRGSERNDNKQNR